jgi:hypothetical protein
MAKPTPQSTQTQVPPLSKQQTDAVDALRSPLFKIPAEEAIDLVRRSPGKDAGEMVSNAIRLRAGKPPVGGTTPSPVPPPLPPPLPQTVRPVAPPQGARLHSVGTARPQQQPVQPNWFWRLMGATAPPPAPIARRPSFPPPAVPPAAAATAPPTPSAPPTQLPGFGPPGGAAAAPTAEQLAATTRAAAPTPTTLPPAPVKPRIRVQATPGLGKGAAAAPTPGEIAEAKEKAAGTEEVAPEKPAEKLPVFIKDYDAYAKLPSGTRFVWPNGEVYRKP